MEFVSLPHLPASTGIRNIRTKEFVRGGRSRGSVVTLKAGSAHRSQKAPTGQLWIPLQGTCWMERVDGVKWRLLPGHAVFVAKGETYSQGSIDGAVLFLLQVEDMRRVAD